MYKYEFKYNGKTYNYISGCLCAGNGQAAEAAAIKRDEMTLSLKDSNIKITVPMTLQPFYDIIKTGSIMDVDVVIYLVEKNEYFGDYFEELFSYGNIKHYSLNIPKGTIELTVSLVILLGDKTVPTRFFSPSCTWGLFSSNCGLNKEDYKVDISLNNLTISSDKMYITSSIFANFSDNYFTYGTMEVNNYGNLIIEHTGDTILLNTSAYYLEEPGIDVLTFYPGCDKNIETCKTKFNNEINYGGFPFIPNINPVTEGI